MLFSDWIKKERLPDGRRMTGGKFAQRSGIAPATIYRILRFPWKGLRADTARRIVEQTRGEVTLPELVPVSRYPKANGEGVS